MWVNIVNVRQDLLQLSEASREAHKRKVTLCVPPSQYTPFGVPAIEQLTFDSTSGADAEVLGHVLQALWCARDAGDPVLGLIEACHRQPVAGANGCLGLTFWQVLMVAVIKLRSDVDDDRLDNLLSPHTELHRLAGLPNFRAKTRRSATTPASNIALLSDDVLVSRNH